MSIAAPPLQATSVKNVAAVEVWPELTDGTYALNGQTHQLTGCCYKRDGKIYVTSYVGQALGSKSAFRDKYKYKKHVALGRTLDWFSEKLLVIRPATRRYGEQKPCCRDRDLFLLKDFLTLKALRDGAADESPATVAGGEIERKAANVGSHIRKGNIKAKKKIVPLRTKTGHVQFQTAYDEIDPLDLVWELPDPEKKISLPDAAGQSGIDLWLWHNWCNKEKCALLGKKLWSEMKNGNTAGGFMPLRHIAVIDFRAIVQAYALAKAGRQIRDGRIYLSPAEARKEFVIRDTDKATRNYLGTCMRMAVDRLGHEFGTIPGHYFSDGGRLEHGKMFDIEDLAVLFKRRRPTPVVHRRPSSPHVGASEIPRQPATVPTPDERKAGEGRRVDSNKTLQGIEGDVAQQFRDLFEFAHTKLKKKERKVIVILCGSGGVRDLSLLAKDVGWAIPCDNAFNQTRIRLVPKLKKIGWLMERAGNAARLRFISVV